jgi:UMF1 family MFS transporter
LIATGDVADTGIHAKGWDWGPLMTILPDEPQVVPPAAAKSAGRRAIVSWYLFDWASQPVATLITTFVFAPYFVDYVAANEDVGTAQWGWALAAAGLFVAILSPILGAIADAAGRRKPWIAAFSIPLLAGSLLLWFAEPGASGAVAATLIGVFLATVGAEFAEVFTNAMMPSLVAEERMGRLSGSGWAIGYLGGMIALVIVIGLFVADPDTGETFAGLSPLFGLDPATYEGVRASGPLTALWYLVFVIPLFLFTPDTPRVMAARKAIGIGWRNLRETLGHIRKYRHIVRFLIARMIYADGLAGLFAFGGVYATSTFDWGTTEFLLFGMLVIIAAIPGAFLGGRLDDRFGSKPIILGSITILILASTAALSTTADSIFFGIPVDPPLADDGMFASVGEQIYLLLGALIGLVAGPLQAASRTLIIRMSPKDQITQFTGMFALSGRLTTFAASATVAAVTSIADNQRLGISTLVLFFVVGGLLLLTVNPSEGAGSD